MQLRDYVLVLRRRKVIVILAVIGVVGSAVVASLLQTPVYEARARILLTPTQSVFAPGSQQSVDPNQVSTEIQVISSQPVRDAVREKLGFSPKVSATPIRDTAVVELGVEDTSPRRAASSVNAYVDSYIDYRRKQGVNALMAVADELHGKIDDLQGQIDDLSKRMADIPPCTGTNPPPNCTLRDSLQRDRDALVSQQVPFKQKYDQLQVDLSLRNGGAMIVTPAAVPTTPIRPRPVRSGVFALAAGLVLGVGLAFLLEHLDDSIKGKEDLERLVPGTPVLGVIPAISSWKNRSEPRVVSQSEPSSPVAEAYRSLRTSIQFVGLEKATRVIQMTSPVASEGKTTTVANLAVALARSGQKVVVLSCDLRRPRIHEFFDVPNAVGFTSVLLGEVSVGAALQAVPGEDRLLLLASGPLPPNPSELLASGRTKDLIAEMRQNADVVLVDCPPVVPVTDAAVLAPAVDATLLVATAGVTTTKHLQRALELLRQVDAPLIGLIFNGVSATGDGYGYGYGYGYAPVESVPTDSKPRSTPSRNGHAKKPGAAARPGGERRTWMPPDDR